MFSEPPSGSVCASVERTALKSNSNVDRIVWISFLDKEERVCWTRPI